MNNNVPSYKKHYLTQKDFLEEYNKCLEDGKASSKLTLMFEKIAKNFAKTFDVVNRCDTLACINYAVAEAWIKWDKFNPEISDNIFSFFTTMISNDMKLHYKTLNKGKNVNISLDALLSNENKK